MTRRFKRIAGRINSASNLGEWDKCLKLIKQGEEIIKYFQGDLPKELLDSHCWLLMHNVNIVVNKGYLTRGFEIANDFLTVADKYGIKKHVAYANSQIGHYYWRSGDLDKALVYNDRGIVVMEESSEKMDFAPRLLQITMHSDAMRIAIDKGDLELATKYFKRLEEIYEQKPGERFNTPLYKTAKAIFLKLSR